ncbi:MAG: hypothetical protein IJS08_13355 [Victivallales bacterium]|nr:hypothetical protein [Victivallales bacterium]
MRIIIVIMALFFIASAFSPLAFAQNETREEMLAWIAKLEKQDKNNQDEMETAAQQPRNRLTTKRVEIWDSKTVLKKVAEWRIAHLKDDTKKALVCKEYQEALAHIKNINAAWTDEPSGSGATEFEGTAVVELVRRQIALWLQTDDEYEEWMTTWSNARLAFQGKEIPLISGMAHVKVRNNDHDEIELLIKRENCFTIDGEKYAFVERNYVAAVSDDFNRVALYRLEGNGLAILIEEVVSEHFVSKMKLSKEREGCLRVDWTELSTGKTESTWVLLLK